MEDTRLGAILLEGGIVGEVDLERCLAIQSLTGGVRPIGQILIEQRLLDPTTLKRLLDLQRSRVALRRAEVPAADAMSGTLLRAAAANGASELVVSEGRPVRIRVAGEWRELAPEPLRGPEVWDFVRETMGPEVLEELADRHSVVRAWQDPELGHGAATAFRQFDGVAVRTTFAVRAAMTPLEAALPPAVVEAVRAGRGLVLLVAERGAGRVEALASLLQVAAADKGHYAVVLDDEPLPLPRDGSLVVRRRFGLLPADRTAALRGALREDPDVLAIADVGDPNTFELALRAAEGGRLVLACLDAGSVVGALHRVMNFYAAYDVPRVQQSLAAALKVVVARHLLPDVEHQGTVVANELLVVDESVREALRSGGIDDIGLLLRMEGTRCGHSLDRSLLELVDAGRVRVEDVFGRAEDKAWLLERTLERTTNAR
jgi:twitching motility protein PilT